MAAQVRAVIGVDPEPDMLERKVGQRLIVFPERRPDPRPAD